MAPRVAGWPADLPPAGTQEFDERVVGWLLDRGPADLRGSGLAAEPAALGYVVVRHCAGAVESLRQAYAQARADLGLPPERLQVAQQAMERAGALLAQQEREVALVYRAIREQSPTLG